MEHVKILLFHNAVKFILSRKIERSALWHHWRMQNPFFSFSLKVRWTNVVSTHYIISTSNNHNSKKSVNIVLRWIWDRTFHEHQITKIIFNGPIQVLVTQLHFMYLVLMRDQLWFNAKILSIDNNDSIKKKSLYTGLLKKGMLIYCMCYPRTYKCF